MNASRNEMMIELFRAEVETHAESLTSALLALEKDPANPETLERMMRAAHSIKGAARIVHVSAAVDVAHVMEDCFVAAQKGQLRFKADDVDFLLRAVDLLARISSATKDPQMDWSTFEAPVKEVVESLRVVLSGRNAPERVRGGEPAPGSTRQESRRVITIPARLDKTTAEMARQELVAAMAAGAKQIEIDLSQTQDLDAIGLAFLAAARQFASGSLTFRPVSAAMRAVLMVTGLDAPATGTHAP